MDSRKEIYLDYAATTPVDPRVIKEMLPYFSHKFANPSSRHFLGQEVRESVSKARGTVAKFLGCNSSEIIFTGSGTEAENLAIKGITFGSKSRGNHIIISSVEHNSVISSANFLKKVGFKVDVVPVDKHCNVDINAIGKLINDKTILISVMLANNEVGTVQPIKEISKIIRSSRSPACLHVDAEAAAFYLDCNVQKLAIDSLSINGSKLYATKGIGALFIRKGVKVATQISGGGQERYIRGGTENVPAIIGLAKAVQLAKDERSKNVVGVSKLKQDLIEGILNNIPNARLNTPSNSLPNIAHFTFLRTRKDLVREISKQKIAVSSGSACAANSKYRSHVLEAMGFPVHEIDSSLRFSLGKGNTTRDIKKVIRALADVIGKKQ